MIERISELPWASFEWQLIQKCQSYHFDDHRTLKTTDTWTYWKDLGLGFGSSERQPADAIYSIQNQIIYNAVALNDELDEVGEDVTGDRASTEEVFFWDDLVSNVSVDETGKKIFEFPHKGYANTQEGRTAQLKDLVFKKNNTFIASPTYEDEPLEEPENLTQLPKTHAARSLIEVSEYLGPEHPETKYSNYVSRKVSLLWFFNVIKSIAFSIRRWPWIIIGVRTHDEDCVHDEAEENPDVTNETVGHAQHKFKRSNKPEKDGRLRVYGNAEFNGPVTTFHSQARFHDEVTVWDTLKVYGESFFSKDINGTAMRVRWGDLAEYYESDLSYAPGTLVKFGGEYEITIADTDVNAVVTTSPGFTLNEQLRMRGCSNKNATPIAIALSGRVPVRVWGPCKKFDVLVLDREHPGWAKVQALTTEPPIARALQDKGDLNETVICATNFRI